MQSQCLDVLKNHGDVLRGWFSEHGGGELTFGLADLRCLLQS